MTASTPQTRYVLLRTAARPVASSSAGPQAAKVRRYRLARARLEASRRPTPLEVARGERRRA